MSQPEPRPAPMSAFAPTTGNDDHDLTPQPSPGRGSVAFDLPGVRVGTAEYAEGPTGATVLAFDKRLRTAVDARGGAVGLSGGYEISDAICLAGGSVYGLEAAAGVSTELCVRRENRTRFLDLAHVSGAVIYDFAVRDNAVAPDAALGRAALRAARPGEIPVGRCGAGIGASVGKPERGRAEFAGQGAAFRRVGDVRILVATVVNAVGVVVDREGRIVRGNLDADGSRRWPVDVYAGALEDGTLAGADGGNTTLTVVITNVRLPQRGLDMLARQVHGSMHRAITPFGTELDGDTLFALTTDDVDLPDVDPLDDAALTVNATAVATIASEVAWDAVLESVA